MRTIARTASRRRVEGVQRPCSVLGCSQDTTHRKPFCLAHLDRMPYVRAIKAEFARMDRARPEAA